MNDSHDDDLLKQLGDREREAQRRSALRPLDEGFNHRMAQQIKESLKAATDDAPRAAAPAPQRAWLALAASAVAAVGLSLVVLSRDPARPLPVYELDVGGGAQMRSDSTPAPLQIGDQLHADFRPDNATNEALSLNVFRRDDERWRTVNAIVAFSNSGAARVSVFLNDAQGLTPGPQDWAFILGRSGTLPDATQFNDVPDGHITDDWMVFRHRFDLVP